ncbi:MAG: hypothetical protein ACYDEV_07580 [Acidiferrobacter sp.]
MGIIGSTLQDHADYLTSWIEKSLRTTRRRS